MAADTLKPYVSSSSVQEGTTDIYPVEVYETGTTPRTGYRKVFTFGFNEPMDRTLRQVTLGLASSPATSRTLFGDWSPDGKTLTVTVTPAAAGQLPRLPNEAYFLDLTALKDAAGNPLDTTLGAVGNNGRLDFGTRHDNPMLDHACEDAFTKTPTSVTATATATSSPRTDTVHGLYAVSLPSNGNSFEGFTRMQVPWRTHFLFMNRNVEITVSDPANPNTAIRVTRAAVEPACPSVLTYQAVFGTQQNATLNVKHGPSPEAQFRFVYEEQY
jgi:hypothetical protein